MKLSDDEKIDRLTAVIDELMRVVAAVRVKAEAQQAELARVEQVLDLAEQGVLQSSEAISTLMGMVWRLQTRLDLLTERPGTIH